MRHSQHFVRLLNLLWIAVVAIAVDLIGILVAKIARCGVSGCSGAGFGVSSEPTVVIAAIVIPGLIAAALLIFVPWHRARGVRVIAAVLGALASWAFVSLQYAT